MRCSQVYCRGNIQIMSSLLPSRQFVFSPDLAATIGLEEAILLQCLSETSYDQTAETQSDYSWYQIEANCLEKRLPFWSRVDLGRITENLRQKGVILLASPPLSECGHVRFAFNEKQVAARAATLEQTPASASASANPHPNQARPITNTWRPDESAVKLLTQQGVPENFSRDCVPEFIQYWNERGEARNAWGNRFVSHVLHRWRDYEARIHREQKEADIPSWASGTARARQPNPMNRDWKPSTDALEILEIQAGIHRNFIEDALPEFVLYWSEKGEHSNTWNARFINHVKRQWAGYQHVVKNDLEPRPIDPDWQPSVDVYDVLRFARIELEFAKSLLPEFIIYWRDRNEARPSWNTKFLQFVKSQWARQNIDQGSKATRERTIAEDLTDRSWAS